MLIAYVSLHWPRTKLRGVGKKIDEQLKAWRLAGHSVKLFMHTSQYHPESELIPSERFFYSIQDGILKLARNEYERSSAAARLVEAIGIFQPDLIYIRYGIYIYPIHRLTKIAPVIEEINTNDVVQHKDLGKIVDMYNRASRGILLKRVDGLLCVSHELSTSHEISKYRKPTEVIANGLDLDIITPLPAPNNQTPRIIFIATPGYSWHGVDKIVNLARRFPDIAIDLVGYDEVSVGLKVPDNLRPLGYLPPQAYQSVLAQADLALGTLALHRKKMDEASPLKTRECLAYGLPMVIPYKDSDLDGLECDFLLKIPNREDNIDTHAGAIHEFCFRMRGRRADRSVLAALIDLKAKEARRLTFFGSILHKGKKKILPARVP